MIARIWQGRTRPGMGKAYYEYLESTGLKDYRATKGLEQILILSRNLGDQTEYVLITLWDDMDAVRRFAGPDRRKPSIIRRTAAILQKRSEDRSSHTTK
jgi:heme-degrading monooxygenase HmoA